MNNQYFIGVDLGQSNDWTAISILMSNPCDASRTSYDIRYLERPPLGTPYPRIVQLVKGLAATLGSKATVVIDKTGVGAPVVDMFEEEGVDVTSITITSGLNPSCVSMNEYTVPKRDLISNVQVLLQNRRLRIASRLHLASTLVSELTNFRVKISASGRDRYEAWREGDHDDLVLSVALAAWMAEQISWVPQYAFGTRRM